MTTQGQKAEAFRALHAGPPFVIPNPWDAGSARVLAALGFRALATTSSGFAFTLGRLDGNVTLDEVVAHVASVTRASPAKLATLAGGTPSSHAAVGPRESAQARWARCSLNFDTLAAPAGCLRASYRLRRVLGSTSSRPSSPWASALVIRRAIPAK